MRGSSNGTESRIQKFLAGQDDLSATKDFRCYPSTVRQRNGSAWCRNTERLSATSACLTTFQVSPKAVIRGSSNLRHLAAVADGAFRKALATFLGCPARGTSQGSTL
jgi:hypothetical protein